MAEKATIAITTRMAQYNTRGSEAFGYVATDNMTGDAIENEASLR